LRHPAKIFNPRKNIFAQKPGRQLDEVMDTANAVPRMQCNFPCPSLNWDLIRGGKMLIKNDEGITGRILAPLDFAPLIRGASAAFLCAACVLLAAAPLTAQDLLLKEYIYLDGRLLAVERQVVGPIAQLPAGDVAKQANTELAQTRSFTDREMREPGNSGMKAISGIQTAPALGSHFGSVFAGIARPDGGQRPFMGCEGQALQNGLFRLYREIPEIITKRKGGNNEDM
jgi:hypothetical protein